MKSNIEGKVLGVCKPPRAGKKNGIGRQHKSVKKVVKTAEPNRRKRENVPFRGSGLGV